MLATHVVSEGQSANAYFALATFPADGSDRKAASALRVAVIWADLDCGTGTPHPGKGAARRTLESFALPPHVIVDSGHGLHAYWLLEVALEGEELEDAIGLVRGLAQVLDANSSVADRARIMRAPGTMNIDSEEKKKDGEITPSNCCDARQKRRVTALRTSSRQASRSSRSPTAPPARRARPASARRPASRR